MSGLNGKAVHVPEGWELLPGGHARSIRVLRAAIGDPNAPTFCVEEEGQKSRAYFAVRVLGESSFVHDAGAAFGCGAVYVGTTAPVLVKKAA